MKVALVAGFYEPVRKALEGSFAKHLEVSSLIWIRQVGPSREPDLGELNSQLAIQLAGGAKQVLIIVAILSGKEWVEYSVRAIVADAASSYSGVDVEIHFESKAAHAAPILERILKFGLPEPSEITAQMLRSKLCGEKILCVVMDGLTGFPESLSRCGFPPECTGDKFFVEMVVSRGKNSNLMEVLYNKAGQYQFILYAWTGLRTMPSKVKTRYLGKAFEGPTARDVVNLFKRWLLGH